MDRTASRRISSSWAFGAAAALVALGGATLGAAPRVAAKKLGAIRLHEPSGRDRPLTEFAGSKATVLVFLGTQCPLSNAYAQPLSQLEARYRAQGVRFVGVNANPDETIQAVAKQARDYHLSFPVAKDTKQALADAVGAKVTPEAFVLDATESVRYHGRIDDGYATRTQQRPRATTHDLADAIAAVVAGKPVRVAAAPAVGCAIVRSSRPAAASANLSYHRDIEPILQERCQTCHRTGQVAPFSLLTYADAKRWATEIKTFTTSRQMPPWKAEPGHGEFVDSRRMSDPEIKRIAAWVDAGAPEGNPADAPAPKQWTDGWMLGTPDLVLKMPEPYHVSATGEDDFRVFVLPTGLTEDRWVTAVEIRPGNTRVVHHVINYIDTSGEARKLDAGESGPGYNSGFGGVRFVPSGSLGGWAPGNFPRYLPEGVGMPLPKGSDIAIQVHYHKTGKAEVDQTSVGIYFAKAPIEKRLRTLPLTNLAFRITPGDSNYEVKSSMKVLFDTHALTITPHMHLLGKDLRVTATFPDGTAKDLILVKDWDYRWQDTYRFAEPIAIPKGTQLDLVAHYDNSTGNPRNPNNPPKLVTFGEQTTDEMCFAFIGYTMDQEPKAEFNLRKFFGN